MLEIYNKLIDAVELENIFLSRDSSERFPSTGFKGDITTEVNVSRRLEYRTDKSFVALVNFYVDAFDEFDRNNKLFKIDCSFILEYRLDFINENEIPTEKLDEAIELFIDKNVPINAWPYGREFIAQITSRMGLPQLIIGTYKYIPSNNEED